MAWIQWHTTKSGTRIAHVHWRDSGGRHRSKSTRSADKRIAELQRRVIERTEEGKRDHSARVVRGPHEALRRFTRHLEIARAPDTVRWYLTMLKPLWTAWAARPMAEWNRDDFESYVRARQVQKRPWSPRTIQMLVQACRGFLKWAAEADVLVPDFVGKFKAPPRHRTQPKFLKPEELAALLDVAQGHRLEPAIGLAALAGLRRKEWLSAQAEDIDWEQRTICVRGSKTHQDRKVNISERLAEILSRHPVVRGPLVRVPHHHSNNLKGLKALCRKASIREVSWHPLRHTFATLMVASGAVDLVTTRDLLGHANVATTSIYLHALPERKRAAVERVLFCR